MRINIKNMTVVLLLAFFFSSCDTNNANQTDKSNTEKKNLSISSVETQSKEVLTDAVNALNNVDDEFHWRDTHLILKESQKASSDGKFELSIELAQKVIQQTQLMQEQKKFAESNWQDLIPKK
jgi:hypothetical protein